MWRFAERRRARRGVASVRMAPDHRDQSEFRWFGKSSFARSGGTMQCAETGPLFLLAAGRGSASGVELAPRKVLDGDSTAGRLTLCCGCQRAALRSLRMGRTEIPATRSSRKCTTSNAHGNGLDVRLLDQVAGGRVPGDAGRTEGWRKLHPGCTQVRSFSQVVSQFLGCSGTGIISLGSTPCRRKASACSGIGRATIVKGWSGRVSSLQVGSPRSRRMPRRLWTGRPVSVVPVAAFRFAHPDTSAFCTGVGPLGPRGYRARRASVPSACAGAIRESGRARTGRHTQ